MIVHRTPDEQLHPGASMFAKHIPWTLLHKGIQDEQQGAIGFLGPQFFNRVFGDQVHIVGLKKMI